MNDHDESLKLQERRIELIRRLQELDMRVEGADADSRPELVRESTMVEAALRLANEQLGLD